jgi:hypothetical protein
MYSAEGKRLVNQVLAGREPVVGNTITMGLNVVYDASIGGTITPYTHNRYHTPYIVDEIAVANSSVITELNERDRIIFSGQSEGNTRYMANNMALVLKRNASTRTHRTVANVANGINWSNYAPVTSPTCVFTNDGVLSVTNTYGLNAGTATYQNNISLAGYGGEDIIAFPVSFHGGSPVNALVSMTIFYHTADPNISLQKSVVSLLQYSAPNYYFDFDTPNNYVTSLGTDDQPVPFVFQQRLKEFDPDDLSNPYHFLNNLGRIYMISIGMQSTTPDVIMRFGSIKITPDFAADDSRVTTSFRKLSSIVRKTDLESYVNPEYTLLGVVV